MDVITHPSCYQSSMLVNGTPADNQYLQQDRRWNAEQPSATLDP